MDNQQHPDEGMHPELAFQVGVQQEKKNYDVHPSLQAEIHPEQQAPIEAEAESTIDNEPEVTEPESQPEQEVAPEPVESPKDRDWRQVRAAADEARQLKREKEWIEKERDFYKQQAANPTKTRQEPEEDDFRTETERRLQREMEELKAQVSRQNEEAREHQRKMAVAEGERQLLKEYPDVMQVCSDENVKRLELEYPHLYRSVVASNDVYTVGSAAYEMIVAKGIYKKPANVLKNLSRNNVSTNAAKPRSVSSIAPQQGDSPVTRANNYMGNSISSDEEAKQLYAEMIASSRNRI